MSTPKRIRGRTIVNGPTLEEMGQAVGRVNTFTPEMAKKFKEEWLAAQHAAGPQHVDCRNAMPSPEPPNMGIELKILCGSIEQLENHAGRLAEMMGVPPVAEHAPLDDAPGMPGHLRALNWRLGNALSLLERTLARLT